MKYAVTLMMLLFYNNTKIVIIDKPVELIVYMPDRTDYMEMIKDKIKEHEGLRLKTYKDCLGNLTIGYGCLTNEYKEISIEEANRLLDDKLKICIEYVDRVIPNLKANRRAALIHFCYCYGSTKLGKSTLLRLVKQNKNIDNEILKWSRIGKRKHKGLAKLRLWELALYKKI